MQTHVESPFTAEPVRWLRISDAVKYSGVSRSMIYIWIDEGKIKSASIRRKGVVFKHSASVYRPGRPASGGDALKLKFYQSASFIVTKVNAKRSVMLVLFHGDKIVHAGNVTIPPNHEVPGAGTVVEVRYLYAFRESGCIYQPVYLGPRDDIKAASCSTRQLKYKPEPEVLFA